MVNVVLALLSGFLFFAGFAPWEIWIAPYVAIVLLFRILCDKALPERFTYSLLAGLAFFLPLLHWSSVYVGSIPWLVLAVGESLLFAAIGLVRWQRRWENALLFSVIFTAIELLRMKFPFGGFGWGRLGFTQVDSLNWLYPWIGVTGISLLVSTSAFLLISKSKTIVVILSIIAATFLLSKILSPDTQSKVLQVTAIQGGVDELGLSFNDRAMRVLERHVQATTKIERTNLYVWPENASDVDPIKNEKARLLITDLVRRLESALLVGAVERTAEGPANTSILIGADGEVESRYIKQDLAPFGEYMPVRRIAESISPYAKQVIDFVPGDTWVRHSINGNPFQSLICFEILDDDHVKDGTKGTTFVVAQTNNATFGRSSEAAQQLQITRARAAESAREFVVVSTTGFTSHLDAEGKVLAKASQFTAESLTMNVKLVDPRHETPAQQLSTWFWALIVGLLSGSAWWRISR